MITFPFACAFNAFDLACFDHYTTEIDGRAVTTWHTDRCTLATMLDERIDLRAHGAIVYGAIVSADGTCLALVQVYASRVNGGSHWVVSRIAIG